MLVIIDILLLLVFLFLIITVTKRLQKQLKRVIFRGQSVTQSLTKSFSCKPLEPCELEIVSAVIDHLKLLYLLTVNLFDTAITHMNNNPEDMNHPVLLYISVFCQWIVGNSSTAWKEDVVKSEL